MYDSSEVYEELTGTARNERELNLINMYVKGEKLRNWLINTKEGQAINDEIQYIYARALDEFSSCSPSDIKALSAAKMDLTVAKKIFEIFNGVFNDADNAEKELTEG